MNKQELIKALNTWDCDKVFIMTKEGFKPIKTVVRALGKGIIIEVE